MHPIGYLGLALTAIAIGLAGCLVGLRGRQEFWIWAVAYLAWAVAAGVDGWYDVTLFIAASLAGGLGVGLLQLGLLDRYRKNNPWYDVPATRREAWRWTFPFGLRLGTTFGATFALASWVIAALTT